MLYYLFEYIENHFHTPGFGLFRYITFRSSLAAITALFICFYIGPKIIRKLQDHQIGEAKKIDGPKSHWSKAGTPTMGGIIVILAGILPVLLWSDLRNTSVVVICAGTVALALVGFLDDYLKVIKKYPNGLIGRYKLMGQFVVGLFVGLVVYCSHDFNGHNTFTTLPFLKNMELNFGYLYIPVAIFLVMATSNAVNLTDGLDGLAIGLFTITMLAMAVICYVTGNAVYAKYLNIIHLQGAGELTIFIAAMVGAGLGFLWYNSYPAQVFMGDTGSLALGGAFGILAILVKKELFIPILGGIFFLETISVIIQRLYFKYTKKKYGTGKRVFKMAPIHHHFEVIGWQEPKIVMRFYIIGILLAIITLASFKIR